MRATLKVFGLVTLAEFILAVGLHAQRAALVEAELATIAPAKSAVPDSIVQVTAEAQGLERVAFEKLPRTGTFWVATTAPGGGLTAPLPCAPKDASLPVYAISDGIFLVDATGGQVPAKTGRQAKVKITDALEAQAGAVVNLISQVQEAEFNQEVREIFGLEEEPEASGSFARMLVADTNGLWLEITNYTDDLAYVTLNNATNLVYEIWAKTNLLSPAWTIERTVWPTNSEVMPFTVPTLHRPDLFIWARDWTDVDDNSNGIPDWWEWTHFGGFSQLATDDYDGDGIDNATEYANDTEPNNIRFTVRLGNQNFNTTNATGRYLIVDGVPSQTAVLINREDFTNAVWQPYDGNIAFNFGPTNGVYQVWFGLKGRAENSEATWIGTDVTLNRQSPAVSITSQTAGVVAQPWLQVKGFSARSLKDVRYDLINTDGVVTNESGSITSSFFDTNQFDFTTNYFQCYDLRLAEGTNFISLHAVDPAGNLTTTNFSLVLDYSSATSPVIQVAWPQNGLAICGSSFTVRGWTEDAAAQVNATVTDDNGHTNKLNGAVERDGRLWVQALTLNAGTNHVTLAVTNAAGFGSTTNFTVVKSSMALAVTSVDGSLWLPAVNVHGIISDPTAVIWVNGVQGTNNGDGTWNASNVPVPAGTIASFDVNAIPAGAGDPSANYTALKPSGQILESARWTFDDIENVAAAGGSTRSKIKGHFSYGKGGNKTVKIENYDANNTVTSWSKTETEISLDGGSAISTHSSNSTGWEDWSYGGVFEIEPLIGAAHRHDGNYRSDQTSNVKFVYYVGGALAQAGAKALVEATGAAAEIWPETAGVPATEITAGQVGQLDADGLAYKKSSVGASLETTSKAGRPLHTSGPGAGDYRLIHLTQHPALTDTNRARLNLGVGEEVDLSGMPASTVWAAPGLPTTTNGGVLFIAPSNAPPGGVKVTVTATVHNSATLTVEFTVFPPTGVDHSGIASLVDFPVHRMGSRMINSTWIAPTFVCLYRVYIMEIGENATNVTGYFADTNLFTANPADFFQHTTADHWLKLNEENAFGDSSGIYGDGFSFLPPWSSGSFSWNIPARWSITPSDNTNSMSGWSQKFTIEANGTVTVEKFGHSATRTTNNDYTVSYQ